MREVDYYELLGVGRDATAAQIRSAYRARAKQMHPDAGGTPGTFHLLREAYETLLDPRRRAGYDGYLTAPPVHPADRRRGAGRRPFGAEPGYVPPRPRPATSSIPWWDDVDPAARVRYVPSTAFGSAPALGTAACGLAVVLPFALRAELSPVLLAVWLVLLAAEVGLLVAVVRRYRAAAREARAVEDEFGARVHGNLPDADDEPAARLTARLLSEYLTRLPGARIFHGLSLPGSVFSDVDHAVLCGGRLVLIDSRCWLPGHYTTDVDGGLLRNGHTFRGGALGLADAVAAYRRALPRIEVSAAMVLYPSRSGRITTRNAEGAVVPVLTPQDMIRRIGAHLAADPVTVDREAFLRVAGQVRSY